MNFGSQLGALAQGGLISIYGKGLGSSASTAAGGNLPTLLGGTCVTAGSTVLPLAMTSDAQINALLPQSLGTGRYALTVHSLERGAASTATSISVAKYAPAVLVDASSGLPAIYKEDGSQLSGRNHAGRDDGCSSTQSDWAPPVARR